MQQKGCHQLHDRDAAVAGKDIRFESAVRAADLELATARGGKWVCLLWEVAKFFDTISVCAAVHAARRYGFRTHPLVQAMLVGLSPRR